MHCNLKALSTSLLARSAAAASSSTQACVVSSQQAMVAADNNKKGKEKEEENEKETDAVARVLKLLGEEEPRSEPEALDGGGSPVDSGPDSEVSFLPCAAHALNTDYEDYCDDGDSDQDQSEDVNSGEFESLEESESGLSDSQEHKLRAPGASLAIPMASGSMSSVSPYHGLQQLLLPSSITPSSVSVKPSVSPRIIRCSGSLPSAVTAAVAVSNGRPDGERREIRFGLPSNGRMANDTLCLLKACQLSVERDNARGYSAKIPQLSNVEVWFQRPEDIVKQLSSGDLDIGIVGFDTFREHGQGNEDLIMVHDALDYGHCRLSLAIPKYGIFEKINSVKELAQMPQWTEDEPLRVATGFSYLGPEFMKESGLKHVRFVPARGSVEAAPKMRTADVILDLVSSGTTLRENDLKEINDGKMFESQAVLVARRKSLVQREDVLHITRKILQRLEAHLKAVDLFMVRAFMSGSSEEEVADCVLGQPSLSGLQNYAVNRVFCKRDGKTVKNCYAIDICVHEKELHSFVEQLQAIRGSTVLAYKLNHFFDEETPKWKQLISTLGLKFSGASAEFYTGT